ncbi:MAG: hypothetical protein ACYTF9_04620 [Planctomycetota bacterium]
MRRPGHFVLVLAGVMTGLAACAPVADPVDPPNEVVAERGPVSAVVRTTPGTGTVGTIFEVVIEAEAEAGISLGLPEIGATLGPFDVTELRVDPDIPTESGRRWRLTAWVQTFESGKLDIAELEVTITDEREAVPAQTVMVLGPLDVEVKSVLDAEGSTEALRDIREDVTLRAPIPPAWWIAGGAGVLLVVGLAVLLILWGRREKAPPPSIPAHVWALGELDLLEREDLIAKGDIEGFFVRLTDVARGYIERRFEVAAPDQTTEEFIRGVPRHRAFPPEHIATLAEFLRAADMVKFARLEPGQAESELALETAREFIVSTRVLSEASEVAA